jgi:hypothetical protein
VGTLGPTGPLGPATTEPIQIKRSRSRVMLRSHTDSLWRGGRLILKGRVWAVFSSASPAGGPRTALLQIRRNGRWRTAARPRLDARGRFGTKPRLRRARRAAVGHSRLMLGRSYLSFEARTLLVRARAGAGHSVTIRVRLRR